MIEKIRDNIKSKIMVSSHLGCEPSFEDYDRDTGQFYLFRARKPLVLPELHIHIYY